MQHIQIVAWRSDMPSRGQCPGPPPPAPAQRMPASINVCVGFSRRELEKLWRSDKTCPTRLESDRTARSKNRVPDKSERTNANKRPPRSIPILRIAGWRFFSRPMVARFAMSVRSGLHQVNNGRSQAETVASSIRATARPLKAQNPFKGWTIIEMPTVGIVNGYESEEGALNPNNRAGGNRDRCPQQAFRQHPLLRQACR